LLMVHTNVFAPTESPVTPDVGFPGVVTELPPAITVQVPAPVVGVFPARFVDVEQTVTSGPALATVGDASRVIVTVSLDEGHVPLLMVHTKVFAPTLNPVTPEVGLPAVVTDALPTITVQAPVPTAGAFPARVALVAQTDWSGPAAAVVGDGSRVIVTVSLVDPQPGLLIVHTNVFAPAESPVTPDVALPGDVTDAVPAITVHDPVPTVGVLPARVAVVEQTVWSGPALAVVGDAALVIVIVSLDEGQEALLMVHTNVLAPTDSAVTPEVALEGVVTEAVPAMTVHTPVPTVGALPARVEVVVHTPKSEPAFAAVGD